MNDRRQDPTPEEIREECLRIRDNDTYSQQIARAKRSGIPMRIDWSPPFVRDPRELNDPDED